MSLIVRSCCHRRSGRMFVKEDGEYTCQQVEGFDAAEPRASFGGECGSAAAEEDEAAAPGESTARSNCSLMVASGTKRRRNDSLPS